MKLLIDRLGELAGDSFHTHEVVDARARDGLTLVAFLTLPVGTDPDGDGIPERPLPMVLNVHGGPWALATLEVCLAILESARAKKEIPLRHQTSASPT